MMRVLITGSRNWNETDLIRSAFDLVMEKITGDPYSFDRVAGSRVTIVSGNCPSGADWLCERLAFDYGFKVERHPADWHKFGRGAGFRRNQEMVDAGADYCFAFIKNESAGATHCMEAARRAGIPTFVYRMRGDVPSDERDTRVIPSVSL
jgi:hypothetical protein